MADHGEAEAHHDEIHMPPNSWAPLWVSLGVTGTMLGLAYIHDIPAIFGVGLVVLISGIVAWIMAALKEHSELH